jgi:hypothetical protein
MWDNGHEKHADNSTHCGIAISCFYFVFEYPRDPNSLTLGSQDSHNVC